MDANVWILNLVILAIVLTATARAMGAEGATADRLDREVSTR